MQNIQKSPSKTHDTFPEIEYEQVPKYIQLEEDRNKGTAYICIANGSNNILSRKVLFDLIEAMESVEKNSSIRYVVFHAGRISKAPGNTSTEVLSQSPLVGSEWAQCNGYFSTGADIKEMSDLTMETAREYSQLGQRVMQLIRNSSKTTIAVIPRGFCVGGGMELIMSCSYRISHKDAKFRMPELSLDIIPGWGGTQTLPYHIGSEAALSWLQESNGYKKNLDAETALKLGLIDYILDNPLWGVNAMIREDGAIFVSRSHKSEEKITLRNQIVSNYEKEAEIFSQCWNNGTPAGITRFLEKNHKSLNIVDSSAQKISTVLDV